jgi:hypothetical protein
MPPEDARRRAASSYRSQARSASAG